MIMRNGIYQLPLGMRDILPGEAGIRRGVETAILELFSAHGYGYIATPILEYLDTFCGFDDRICSEIYKLVDREGAILALRPEITASVARMAANKLTGEALPLRLCYSGPVFRYEEPQAGRLREFCQVGTELIGCAGPSADAEIIALAVETMRSAGLHKYSLGLGNLEFINALVEESGLTDAERDMLKGDLSARNLVSFRQQLGSSGVSPREREIFEELHTMCGGREVIARAEKLTHSPRGKAALAYLDQVFVLLDALGVAEHVLIDLSIVRDLDYYTGVVFEGYVQELGSPLCGGGRYDRLLDKFGKSMPATGFALGLDRLMLALGHQGVQLEEPGVDLLIASDAAHRPAAAELARQKRQSGQRVLLDLEAVDQVTALARAADRGIEETIWLGDSGDCA